ncbi:helix-turn-helix domain-containing protein [Amycolatopsis anabasis]|uniref:helix-turn-helix domain-containing protein n=1 Tax=Amycolatopsis anabasis TaxID=1840409 RepID=UPI00131E3C4F|nr:helix-turn-helix transcriptional regulator [Amycolatopsis anabasis]
MTTGDMLRMARQAAGLSLAQMGQRVNYTASYLSLVETGKRRVVDDVVAAYEGELGIADWSDYMDRREFLSLSGGVVAGELIARSEGAPADQLASILSATRRLEDNSGAAAVLPAVRGFSLLAERLTKEARLAVHSRTACVASEILQYRGWLEFSTGRRQAADGSIDRGIQLAKAAKDPDRLVRGLSFLAHFKVGDANVGEAGDLIDATLRVKGAHPMRRVSSLYHRARVQAVLGESYQAQRTLADADKSAEKTSGRTPPEDVYWYSDGLWGLYRGRVLYHLGQREQGLAEVRSGLTAMPAADRSAEWCQPWRRSMEREQVPD